MADEKSYGWAGKILRVDLTTGSITTEPTDPYKGYIGGMGLANKIIYDEVPVGTDPFAPESEIVFAVGPLTASGVPLAGRTTVSFLATYTTDNLVVDAHTGGMLGAKLKFAGYDGLVLQGSSDTPVYLNINDDQVAIKDAGFVWGLGTRETAEVLNRLEGASACVASIGKAGESLLPYACLINSRNHSAGAGLGAIMGSKKLKAIVVEGSGSVNVADPQAVAELSDYMLREIVGSNNNHVVPSTQQEWAEYFDPGSRWTSQKGLTWGLAEGGAIETGEPKPGDINTVGYRCMKSFKDEGPEAEKYTIKMNGCHSCPIHCHSDMRVPANRENAGYEITGNTCVPNFPFTAYMIKMLGDKTTIEAGTEAALLMDQAIGTTVDDLGLWCNYGQLYRDIAHCIVTDTFKEVLPEDEYRQFDWDALANGEPKVMVQILRHIAANDNEMSFLGYGPIVWTQRWNDAEWFDTTESCLINYRGWPVHHAHESQAQVGCLPNMLFNRDPMIHSHENLHNCGLPVELKREIAAELWGGEDALDADKNYTPMNDHKANYAWWSVVTDVLHDSLTVCNWVWPMTMSPTSARDYRGDLDLEAKFYTAVTGEDVTTDELYKRAAKIMTLQRAATVRGMRDEAGTIGCTDCRNVHDVMTSWPYDKDPDIPAFTEGTDKMDRADFQTGLTMLYEKFGWDPVLGCPTAECLDYYDMPDVKADLAKRGLLPDVGNKAQVEAAQAEGAQPETAASPMPAADRDLARNPAGKAAGKANAA
ncbi:aldehyde ferredoxin oxidoreductase [Eggerthellaceae bacterium zg-887]|uniref:aldehyde ferredoxin oxidoreductase n=1 Tax=Xiamenia xianingshaonis TaxID=2682776 RepID=UPI00140AA184|nr:aldehyde ferredoxin oxidoreductase [Xiamenia xianingshaonis]NHM16890.1 aldehyde ferredoxin oxidoreductase [Xiamenia xianingshaonis]